MIQWVSHRSKLHITHDITAYRQIGSWSRTSMNEGLSAPMVWWFDVWTRYTFEKVHSLCHPHLQMTFATEMFLVLSVLSSSLPQHQSNLQFHDFLIIVIMHDDRGKEGTGAMREGTRLKSPRFFHPGQFNYFSSWARNLFWPSDGWGCQLPHDAIHVTLTMGKAFVRARNGADDADAHKRFKKAKDAGVWVTREWNGHFASLAVLLICPLQGTKADKCLSTNTSDCIIKRVMSEQAVWKDALTQVCVCVFRRESK